ncbi:MAG: hypothetical protein U0736_01965 [Gemmataceae bacterium]
MLGDRGGDRPRRNGGGLPRFRRAADAEDGPPVAAIKVLAAELAVEVGFQQRFQREIDILRQLDHPGIVRLYDSGVDQNRYWYAMELVDGPRATNGCWKRGGGFRGRRCSTWRGGSRRRHAEARPRSRRDPPRPEAVEPAPWAG